MYTQIPNQFIDKMSDLHPTAVMIFLVICRKTIGWHKQSDNISLSQFMQITGLSKPTVVRGLQELRTKGIITVTQGSTNQYCITVHDEPSDDGNKLLPEKIVTSNILLPLEDESGNIFLQEVVTNFNTQNKVNKPKTKQRVTTSKDDRLSQWQFTVYRELTRYHVPHAWRDKVAELTDEQLWRTVITKWIGRGYRPTTISGMIDWYYKEQNNDRRNSRQDVGTSPKTVSDYIEANRKFLTDEI